MNKIWLGIQGYISCFGWVLQAIARWLWEECPDLRFWKGHTNLDDHLWYAERVNGRVAMVTLSILLVLELISHKSIWDILQIGQHNALLL